MQKVFYTLKTDIARCLAASNHFNKTEKMFSLIERKLTWNVELIISDTLWLNGQIFFGNYSDSIFLESLHFF